MEQRRQTARYQVLSDSGGYTFRFYCDLSGERICTTPPIRAVSADAALARAWEESRLRFNRCPRCGRFASNAMFNIAAGACVDCAVWEDAFPAFCPHCGVKLPETAERLCPGCGRPVRGGGIEVCGR